jgi:HEAT repeat protein
MRKTILVFMLVMVAGLATNAAVRAQGRNFINVEGANLRAKTDAAIKQARSSSQQSRFWTAYSFDVRPGVAVDMHSSLSHFSGNIEDFSGISILMGRSNGLAVETRNLAVFTLYEPDGNTISRLEIYNLDRPREYSGYPVYYLGRAGNEESLNSLSALIDSTQSDKLAERATMAVGLHDDFRVAGILKAILRKSTSAQVRNSSIFWLGQVGGEQTFLADLVRNERESMEIRKQAVFAIGVGKDATSLTTLKSLYSSISIKELKRKIVFAVSINENEAEAVDFLIRVAGSEEDAESKKQALFWLGQKAGERSLKALGDAATSSESETEVQKSAVHAISRRPKEEAVPMLIKIAKTHPKSEVRKQAFMMLARSGDERALELFKEILSK